MHGIGDGIGKVNEAEEDHKGPALQPDIEGQIHHQAGGKDADELPGLVLAPLGAGTLDDVAHDGSRKAKRS